MGQVMAWCQTDRNVGPDLWHHMASLGHNELTHLPLNKMAVIVVDDMFKWIFLNENGRILIQSSLKFVPRSPNCQ